MTDVNQRDQRLFPRRLVPPVPVVLAGANGFEEALSGQVVDYSPSGLSVNVSQAVPVNTVLTVRPVEALPAGPALPIRVRNCQAQPDHWRLGCAFVRTQRWDDLWLFGAGPVSVATPRE